MAVRTAVGVAAGMAALAAAGGTALAEPALYAVEGDLYGVAESETVHEAGALALRHSSMVATFAAKDPGSALHLATFVCEFISHAATEASVRYQGRVGASGVCLVTDRDGDVHAVELRRPPGTEVGSWTVARGTGKWQDAAGTGSYEFEFLTTAPKPQLRFVLTGEITTP